MTTQTEFTAKDIHAEFYAAEEKILREAKAILGNTSSRNEILAAKARKLGFGSSKPVKSANEFSSKRAEAGDIAHCIEYYRERYPLNKFITEEEVQRICKKYGLLLGEAANYTGDIPEKNLENIERFVLREEDYYTPTSGWFDNLAMMTATIRTESDTFILTPNTGTGLGFSGVIPTVTSSPLTDYLSTGIDYGRLESDFENSYRQLAESMGFAKYTTEKKKVPKLQKPPFKICAPERDFHTSGYEVRDGYRLVYDPVVLQPVKKGYLIVDAWGEEASDEIVMNPVKN